MRTVGNGQWAVDKAMSFKVVMLLLCTVINGQWSAVSGQSISATIKADSTKILIGDHLHVKFVIKHSKDYQISNITIDTALSLETLYMEKLDTSLESGNTVLTQNMTMSGYDSGQFYVGPVKVFFTKNGIADSIKSNEILVDVATVAVDTTKPFKAIKAPLDVPYVWQEFIAWIIGGFVLLLAITTAVLLWYYYNKRKPVVVERPRPKDPAHIWARRELKKLEEEKLWQQGDVKMYYSRLTDILRLYLEYRFNWMALESTTEEIAQEVHQFPINDVAKGLLLETLRGSDLVKFAKMNPMPDANMRAMESAKSFIEVTIPVEVKQEIKK